MKIMPPIDPDDRDPYFFRLCDPSGTNEAGDDGILQGATIDSYTLVSTSITVDDDNSSSVTIGGISYPVDTVITAWLQDGVEDADATVRASITLSDGRVRNRTMVIPVKTQ